MKIKKYLKNKIKYISIFSIVILFGCSYNFSEDNFVNIEIPSTDENFIIFKNFKTNDTINTVKTIEYNFNSSVNQNTLESKVYLDNEEINSNWNSNLGSFIVRPSRYTDGIHTLKITHIFTSGSGSIKDQVSREFLTKSETFKFVVKRKPSSPPSITSVTIENGSIKIK